MVHKLNKYKIYKFKGKDEAGALEGSVNYNVKAQTLEGAKLKARSKWGNRVLISTGHVRMYVWDDGRIERKKPPVSEPSNNFY